MQSDGGHPTLGHFVEESLSLLAVESPVHLQSVGRALERLRVVIGLGVEAPVSIGGTQDGDVTVSSCASEGSDVELTLSSRSLLQILDGDITFEQAVLDGTVVVRGGCEAVLAFDDALRAWAHGAIRAPSFSDLLQRLKVHYSERSDR